MDYEILGDELKRDEYRNLTDQDAADALNANVVAWRVNVPLKDINILARRFGLMLALRVAKRRTDSPVEVSALAEEALSLFEDRTLDEIDMDDPASMGLMAGLMQVGLLTEEQAAAFDGLANGMTSRREQLGLPVVTAGDVQSARAGGE